MRSLQSAFLFLVLGSLPAFSQTSFPLTDGVPDDAFLVISTQPNEERAFLAVYWERVFAALHESGVAEELTDLAMQSMGEAANGDAEQARGLFESISNAVDWDALCGGEAVYAKRFSKDLVMPGPFASIGGPEWVALLRTDVDTTRKNFGALSEILQNLTGEISARIGVDLEFDEFESEGSHFLVLNVLQMIEEAPRFELSIGQHEDVLIFTIGSTLRAEVTALLGGEGDRSSISRSARFQSSFEGMPAPEDGFVFLDIRTIQGILGKVFEAGLAEVRSDTELAEGEEAQEEAANLRQFAEGLVGQVMDAVGMFDYSLKVSYTEGHAVHSRSVLKLTADAESSPLYPVIAGVHSFDSFAQYLPKETSAFAVKGNPNMVELYDFLEDSIARTGATGDEILGQIEQLQADMEFDIRKDVLSLLGNQSISATFELDGAEEWISMYAVGNGEAVAQFLALGLSQVPMIMGQLAEQNPMAGMFTPKISPTNFEGLEGFHDINIAMMGAKVVCGVQDDFLIFSSSPEAVMRVRETARGEAPNVLENERLAGLGLFPQGPALAVSFKDQSGIGEALAGMFGAVQMMGGMAVMQIPSPEGQQIAGQLMAILGSLAPAAQELDFFDSTAGSTTFDGQSWWTHTVTNYRIPEMPSAH